MRGCFRSWIVHMAACKHSSPLVCSVELGWFQHYLRWCWGLITYTVVTDEYSTSVLFMRYLCNQTHASDIGSYCFQPSMCCTQRTSHLCFSHNSASSCCFAADMPSMLIDVSVNAGPDKGPCCWHWDWCWVTMVLLLCSDGRVFVGYRYPYPTLAQCWFNVVHYNGPRTAYNVGPV